MIKKIWVFIAISIACFDCAADANDVVIVTNQATSVTKNSQSTTLGVSSADLKKNAPSEYTVKKTDTVSRLASMFLKKISLWPQFLGVDQLAATKLYPGDKLKIVTVDSGRKILIVSLSGSNDNYYQKLTPEVRSTFLNEMAPIPTTRLKTMLLNPVVMSKESFEALPMVVGGSNPSGMYYSMGDDIYVKGYKGSVGDKVMVLSRFRDLVDPDTKEKLGQEYRYDGEGIITQMSDLSSIEPTNVLYQITALDRVAPAVFLDNPDIVPHRSDYIIDGKIIAMYDSLTATGQNNSVVINKGSRDGVQVGTVFDITDGHTFIDPTSVSDSPKYLVAPEVSIGEILVYKVYDKVSFALITDSTKEIPMYAKIKSQ